MAFSFYYIADGKAYLHRDGKDLELRSTVLKSYIEAEKREAKASR